MKSSVSVIEKSAAISALRSQNCADFERLRAGIVGPPRFLDTAETAGDPLLLIECLIVQAAFSEMENSIADLDEAFARIRDLQQIIDMADVRPILRWGLAFVQSLTACSSAKYERAMTLATEAESLVEGTDFPDAQASTLNLLGVIFYRLEAFDRAVEFFTLSIATPGLARSTALAHAQLATVFETQHEYDLALSHRRIALELIDGLEVTDRYRFECDLCLTLINIGRFQEAHDALATLWGPRKDAPAFVALLSAELALGEDRLDDARSFASNAATHFEAIGLVGYELRSISIVADVHLRREQFETAIAILISKAVGVDTIDHERYCRQLVEAYRQLGQWENVVECQEHLRRHMRLRQLDLHAFHQLQERSFHFEALRAKNRAIDDRNQEVDMLRSDRENLLKIVAHELRSPMTALGLVLHSIEERAALGVSFNDRVRTGAKTVRRMQGIASQVATVGELTTGTFEVDTEPVDLDAVISRVVDEQSLAATRKGMAIVATRSGHIVRGHQGRLEQVLTNLVSNALKFADSGSAVAIKVAATDTAVEVAVIDQGPGLTALDLDRVFRRHARLSARPTAGEPSSGMGLFIAKQLSLAMGGDLVAASAGQGLGAVFTVQLQASSEPMSSRQATGPEQ